MTRNAKHLTQPTTPTQNPQHNTQEPHPRAQKARTSPRKAHGEAAMQRTRPQPRTRDRISTQATHGEARAQHTICRTLNTKHENVTPPTGRTQVHDRGDPPPRPINYQFLNRRLLWDHWAKMAYAVAPLVNWGSVQRAVSGGAARLRREARALGIFGGGGGDRGSMLLARRGAGVVPGGGDSDAAAATVLTACVECGANPAKVRCGGFGVSAEI